MRALAFAYFGAAPMTRDGTPSTLAPDGVRDPLRGTPYAPSWPPLPVTGSPVDALMTSFDDEGHVGKGAGTKTMTRLHAHLTMDLNGP